MGLYRHIRETLITSGASLAMELALFRLPPLVTIFLGPIADGVLAVIVAPERVIRFA